MFKVDADSVESYFAFDPARTAELQKLDRAIRAAAPTLNRYFHAGTPVREPGMRFKMIGYGPFHYRSTSGKAVEWPVIGVALQKNYISVYIAVARDGTPLTDRFVGRLGELRVGHGNFSFDRFDMLEKKELARLFSEAEALFNADPASVSNRMD